MTSIVSRRLVQLISPAAASGAISGTAALVFGQTGAVTGAGALAGTSALLFGQTGAVTGAGALVGASALVFDQTGAVTDLTPPAGLTPAQIGGPGPRTRRYPQFEKKPVVPVFEEEPVPVDVRREQRLAALELANAARARNKADLERQHDERMRALALAQVVAKDNQVTELDAKRQALQWVRKEINKKQTEILRKNGRK